MSGSTDGPQRVASLRDIEGIESVPLSARGLPSSTYEMLRRGAQRAPESPALSFFLQAAGFETPFVWTHAQWFGDITRAANLFRRLGVERGDVVAFALPNLPETHLAIWGGEATGIAFALNPLLEAEAMARLLNAGGAKWLVTLGPTPGLDLWEKASRAAADAPSLQGLLTVDLMRYAGRSSASVPQAPREGLRVLDFRGALSGEAGDALAFAPPGPEDISSYFCTGGTTGLPKIARRTHRSEVFDAWAMQRVTWGEADAAKTLLCGLPLFHVNGQLVTGLAPWSSGGHVVLATPQGYRDRSVVENLWAIVERYAVHAFSAVPAVYAALSQIPVGARDISSLAFGACGAAPMPVELFRGFEARTGVRIVEAYGLTEAACVSSVNPVAGEARIGSVGLRLPYQQMAAVILDAAGLFVRFAVTDEPGVLALRGPNVFAGYIDPAHETGLWIDIEGETWLNTGDLARQDAEGYFWLTGRRKELIIRGGHNIDPRTIEEAMAAHPAVALAAAVGRPDERVGEVPVVYVQLRQDANATEAELLAHAWAHVAERSAHPKEVILLPALPLTAVGKVFKPALIQREIAGIVRDVAARTQTQLAALDVVQDDRRGLVARVEVDGDGADLATALGAFPFAHEITTRAEGA